MADLLKPTIANQATIERFTVQWWSRFKDEPTPIYDALVAERLHKLFNQANSAFAAGQIAGYARLVTLADRIRQRAVPPWTQLDA